jgi:hypothetical protein
MFESSSIQSIHLEFLAKVKVLALRAAKVLLPRRTPK